MIKALAGIVLLIILFVLFSIFVVFAGVADHLGILESMIDVALAIFKIAIDFFIQALELLLELIMDAFESAKDK